MPKARTTATGKRDSRFSPLARGTRPTEKKDFTRDDRDSMAVTRANFCYRFGSENEPDGPVVRVENHVSFKTFASNPRHIAYDSVFFEGVLATTL